MLKYKTTIVLLLTSAICLIIGLFVMMSFMESSAKWKSYTNHRCIVNEGENIALDDFSRKVIGYDSIEIIEKQLDFEGTKFTLEVNFCYPNQWERNKWRNDTIYIIK